MRKVTTFIIGTILLINLGIAVDIPPSQSIPSSNTITDNYYFSPYINFSTSNLSTVIWNWNNTNYTLFDESLVLMMNFDNRSSLGENDTLVKDLSKYGNNGTIPVMANLTWTADAGKYNGAFVYSKKAYGHIAVNNLLVNYSNGTASFWVNTSSKMATAYAGIISADLNESGNPQWHFQQGADYNDFQFYSKNSSGSSNTISLVNIPNGWNFITVTWNGTYALDGSNQVNVYLNGVLNNPTDNIGYYSLMNDTFIIGALRPNLNNFNGTIDELMIWNRSLSSSEVTQLYKTQLTKYNNTNWQLYSNQSIRNENLSTTNVNEAYDYGLFVNDTSGNSNSTANVITRIPLLTSTSGNYTTQVGTVRSDFYGVGTYRKFFAENGVYINSTIGYANSTWNRETYLDTNIKLIRQLVYLNRIYSNDTAQYDLKVYNTSELSLHEQEAKWTNENNINYLVTIVGMPTYLQNRSSYCNSSYWESCPSINYTAYNQMVLHLLNNITNYGQRKNILLEIGNEPYQSDSVYTLNNAVGWCNNVTTYDNRTKALLYVDWYNSTYNAIKDNSTLSYISIGGPAGYRLAPNLMSTFLSNASSAGYSMDFVSIHPYGYTTSNQLNQYNDAVELLTNCTTYGGNCSRIIFSEWGTGTISLKNTTSLATQSSKNYAQSYISILNYLPSNITMSIWDWSENVAYIGGDQYWEMVVQPELVSATYNQYKPQFNVTKNFATYCPAGSTVYASSSNYSEIKSVSYAYIYYAIGYVICIP